MSEPQRADAVIVGAGFSGLYQLYRLRELGLTTRVFEAGDDVGGTWYWNRYPGARCDVQSLSYSYGFSPNSSRSGTGRRSTRPSRRSCATSNHVADRFDLRRDITFSTRVVAAHWDDAAARWLVRTDAGEEVTRTVPDHGHRLPVDLRSCRRSQGLSATRAARTTPRAGARRTSDFDGMRVESSAPAPLASSRSRSSPSRRRS